MRTRKEPPQPRHTTTTQLPMPNHDRSAWGVDLKSMVFETRLKPGPTKAKRYGGASWGNLMRVCFVF